MVMPLPRRLALFTLPALLLAGCAATTSAESPAAPAAPSTSMALSTDTMRDAVRELSSDAYEGRAPGTPGGDKTIAYLTRRFAEVGLQPGNRGGWTQTVPLVEITATGMSPLTVTGNGETLRLIEGKDFVAGTNREQATIAIDKSDIVFVGHGIVAPERGWNDYAGVDVRGKTVLMLVNDPDYGTESLEGPFGGRAMTYYGRWRYKFEEAARQGAAAAFIIHDTDPAAYGWNVVESSWTGPQYVAASKDGGASETLANGWLQKDVAARLLAMAGAPALDGLIARARQGPSAFPLKAAASLRFDNRIARTQSSNVIGLLPGRERPEEVVLYTAHWDHLGRCKPAPDGDDICNGAVDNATGTSALITLAERFAKGPRPARSIVFLAVTAEESGLLGSAYYGANPVFPLAQTVGGVNMDGLSMAGPARNLSVVGMGKSELDAVLAAAAAAENRVPEREPTPEKGYYYRSDHFSLAKQGVPMLYFESGEDLVNGGTAAGRAAADDYTNNRYHGPKDEYDPAWDWSGVMADLGLYHRIGLTLADGSDWPNWVEGDEFRAIRDRSRAGR